MVIAPIVYNTKYTGDDSDISEHYMMASGLLTTQGKTIIELISVQKSLYNLDGLSSRINDAVIKLDTISEYDSITEPYHGNNLIVTNPSVKRTKQEIEMNDTENDNTKRANTKQNEYLVKNLNLIVKEHESIVITGGDGTGKTSVLRTLCWVVGS
jgi:ABC-type uncharacterized transport system fused permease/ATPase subunit